MLTRSFFRDTRKGRGNISRRAFFAAAAAPLLARCSSDPNSDTTALAGLLGRALNPFSHGSSVSLDEVVSAPFASLGVRVGTGPQTLLLLATRSGQSTVWTSASHIALELQSGRITRTAGFAYNLSGTAISGTDPLEAGLQNLRASAGMKRSLDFADRNAFGVLVESTVSPAGPAEIDVLGTKVKTLRAIEHANCTALGWAFTNEYWADWENGIVWRSTQYIHPDFDAVEIQLFRPPRSRG